LYSSFATFENVSDLLKRTFNISVSEYFVKETAEEIGSLCFQNELEEAEDLNKLRKEIALNPPEPNELCYTMIDGSMINTTKGWKENKLGLIFSGKDAIEHKNEKDEVERISIEKKHLVTSLGRGTEDFKKRFHKELYKSGLIVSDKFVSIIDGAPWIENIINEILPGSTIILDWYHASEKIWGCGKQLYGEGTEKTEKWVTEKKDLLWNGKVKIFFSSLLKDIKKNKNQTPLIETYNYFKVREHMIQYQKFKKKKFFVGSGAIESANKYAIQSRLKQAGMRWADRGANAIAKLKTIYFSNKWDTLWDLAIPTF